MLTIKMRILEVRLLNFLKTGFVIKKSNFEQIVGLQEEYKEKAFEVADNMIKSGNFIGGEKLKELIE